MLVLYSDRTWIECKNPDKRTVSVAFVTYLVRLMTNNQFPLQILQSIFDMKNKKNTKDQYRKK